MLPSTSLFAIFKTFSRALADGVGNVIYDEFMLISFQISEHRFDDLKYQKKKRKKKQSEKEKKTRLSEKHRFIPKMVPTIYYHSSQIVNAEAKTRKKENKKKA